MALVEKMGLDADGDTISLKKLREIEIVTEAERLGIDAIVTHHCLIDDFNAARMLENWMNTSQNIKFIKE